MSVFLGNLISFDTNSDTFKNLKSIVNYVVEKVIFVAKLIFCAALFRSNPVLFYISTFVGAAWPKESKEITDRIWNVWVAQSYYMQTLIGFVSFLALPVSIGMLSIYTGLYVGNTLASKVKS